MVSPVIPVRPNQTPTPQSTPPSSPPSVTPLTESTAESHLLGICFKIGPPRLVGVEAEWFVHDTRCPEGPVDPHRVAAALALLPAAPGLPDSPGTTGTASSEPPLLPAGARLTREPGGQVELSSPPADSPADCAEDLLLDQAELRTALAAQGLRLTGSGTDPLPRERRMQLDHPRYLAMEKFFDRAGPWGRIMMTGTASVQVNVDAGADSGPHTIAERWRLTHLLGPVLVAAFANSPLLDGRPTGYRSTRQLVWSRMDPTRTLAPAAPNGAATDPRESWARYVLDAELLCVQRPDGRPWTAPAGLTFRDWLRGAGERPPSLADLDYHRTTLFPPVRPRGHLELRMIDAQPGDGWLAPLALVSALLDDPSSRRPHDDAHRPAVRGGPARADRHRAVHRPGPHRLAHRPRGRPRTDRPALPLDVPAGLGPRPHRQSGGTLAAAQRRRP